MTLYKFTYIDTKNLNESQLIQHIQDFLEEESVLQGWAPGYSFRQSKNPENIDKSLHYFFEVIGRYLDSDETQDEDEVINPIKISDSTAAAGELTI